VAGQRGRVLPSSKKPLEQESGRSLRVSGSAGFGKQWSLLSFINVML